MPVSVVDTEPVHYTGLRGGVIEYEGSISSGEGDLLIRTPAAGTGNRIWIVSMFFSESVAINMTIKSGSSKTKLLKLAANQGVYDKVGAGYLFSTLPGEPLTIATSATLSSVTIRVVESPTFGIS